MRGLLSLCLVLLLGMAGAEAQSWSEYRPGGGRFRIEMPGTPTVLQEPISLPGGRTSNMSRALVEIADEAYLVTYNDYPADVIGSATPQELLIRARDGSAKGHKLRSDRTLAIGGYPAREYVIDRENNLVLVTRSILAGDRLYQMVVVTVVGGPDRPESRRFLDSFNLVAQ